MCTTVLHGGVCHRTSTPHKSGNKMKEKKKNMSKEDDNLMKVFEGLYKSIVSVEDFDVCNSDATKHG